MNKLMGIFAMLGLVCFGAHPAEAAKTYTFKLAHNLPAPESSYDKAAVFFKERLEKHTNGRATVNIYPAAQLGSDVNIAKELQNGSFDFEIISTNKLGAFFPPIDLYSLPFLFPDFDAVAKVVKSEQHKKLMADMEKKAGFKSLAFIGSGFRNVTNSKRPIEKPEDMHDLKMRVPQNRVEIAMFKALGASAVPVSDGELFTALQQGLVDGQDGSALWAYAKKIYEAQKYMSLTAHQLSCSTFIMSGRVFKTLPADIQNAILKAASETETFWQEESNRENAVVMQKFAEHGMIINNPDKEPFMKAMESVYAEFADEVGGMDNIRAIQALIKQ